MPDPISGPEQPHLQRRFGLLQATALNMSNMVGVGPFITIPILLAAMGGPQGMLGWVVAFVITLADGMLWSELGAAMPGSGGSYIYLREGFGREGFGRLMAFLFIWQFIFSGPLEMASGYIGFSGYLGYIWKDMGRWHAAIVAAVVGVVNIALLYRRIESIGKIAVSLWIGTLVTVTAVIVSGLPHFDSALAFDFPPGAFQFTWGFFVGLGAATRIGVYDYLGYYDICYIGEEARDPGRTIPRSILISLAVIAVVYFTMNLAVIGVVPWREFVKEKPVAQAAEAFTPNAGVGENADQAAEPFTPNTRVGGSGEQVAESGSPDDETPAEKEMKRKAGFIVSIFMERIHGPGIAAVFTLLVLWTTFGSLFALLLGYSRIPYAAAQDGCFFQVFARLHPTKGFPHVSLLVIGLLSIACCALPLGEVIDGLILTRVLVQFIGQVFAVVLLRRRAPEMHRPYRVWLYPVPNLVALVGWIFVFATADPLLILIAVALPIVGVLFFLGWSRQTGRWPFYAKR